MTKSLKEKVLDSTLEPEAKRICSGSRVGSVAACSALKPDEHSGIFDAFKPDEHSGILGIPAQRPACPTKPTQFEIIAGEAITLPIYIGRLRDSVFWRLSVLLFEDPEVQLRKPLWTQRTPPFVVQKAGQRVVPTGYKEPFNLSHCVASLVENHIYESSLTLFQYDITQQTYNEIDLRVDTITWLQFETCNYFWGPEKLIISSQDANRSRYIFEGVIPSAIASIDTVKTLEKRNEFFKDLPACGGHALLWSLIAALDVALLAHDVSTMNERSDARETVIKLYEAALNITCRMRLDPSQGQLRLDTLVHMDTLRVLQVAVGAVSFHCFSMAVLELKEITGQEPGMELMSKMAILGITYRGKPVDRNIAYGILSIVGIADKGTGLEAVQFLERVDFRVLEAYSTLNKVIVLIKKMVLPEEISEATVVVVESIALAILAGRLGEEFTGDMLVPKARKTIGFVHVQITSMKFKKWFLEDLITQAAGGACSALSLAGLFEIKKHLFSPRIFWTEFANRDGIDDDVEDERCAKYTAEKWTLFRNNLQLLGDKGAADLLFGVMTGKFFDDFKAIAVEGATFTDYFGGDEEGADDNSDCLRNAMQKFRSCLITAPIPSAAATVDFDHAYNGDEDSADKTKVYKQVTSRRKEKFTFHAIDFSAPQAWRQGGSATQVLQRSRFSKSDGVPGKDNSLMLMCAEVFPQGQVWGADAPNQPVPLAETMKDACKWATKARRDNTMCVFTDGRNKKIRKAFEEIVEGEVPDEQMHYDGHITYTAPSKGDPRFSKGRSFASLSNRETMVGLCPVASHRMTSKGRTHYSACGEKWTSASTYSDVPVRPWVSLPRLTLVDKEDMTGATMPVYSDEMLEALAVGHPLFIHETKEVEFYCALYNDLSATHVFDLTPGSGAAAMAAAILHISYEGLAMNPAHATWLENIMDKAMFPIVTDSKDEEALKIKASVLLYFSSNVKEGRALLAGSADFEAEDEFDADEAENEGGQEGEE